MQGFDAKAGLWPRLRNALFQILMMKTNLHKLCGKIEGLTRSRRSRDFVMSQIGGGVEASAVSASLAGMGGAAISIASIDSNEKADFVEFSLNGESVRGWFWSFPFQEGDEVEVVAERSEDGWTAYGARRQADALVAVYPHCFEGRWAHYVSTFRFWGVVIGSIFLFLMVLDAVFSIFEGTFSVEEQLSAYVFYLTQSLPIVVLVFGFLAWRGGRKTEGFARIAENIFNGFGWANASRINLRQTSRRQRREGDGRDYGVRYFRY